MTKLEAFNKVDESLNKSLATKLAKDGIIDSQPLYGKSIYGIYHDICLIQQYRVGFYTLGEYRGMTYAVAFELPKDDLNQLMLSDGICLDKTSEKYEGKRIYDYIAVELPKSLLKMFRSKYKCTCE